MSLFDIVIYLLFIENNTSKQIVRVKALKQKWYYLINTLPVDLSIVIGTNLRSQLLNLPCLRLRYTRSCIYIKLAGHIHIHWKE